MRCFSRFTYLFWLLISGVYLADTVITLSPSQAADATASQRYSITSITDGDSIRSHDIRIRLHGIDAPEMRQMCRDQSGKDYQCGHSAKTYLQDLLRTSSEVMCQHLDTDRYQRKIMRCFAKGIDINAAMVRAGWAVAYRRYSVDYIAEEIAAKQDKKGLWQGHFEFPETWRRNH
ncbi:MAG: thermonuclease family protein [Candidatus Puniceispirillaceae bacterium]